jgi:hypothetical protein
VDHAEHVGAQRPAWVEPRLLDARLSGQVHDRVGAGLGHDRSDRSGVVEVGLDQASARRGSGRQAAARRDDPVDDAGRLLAPQELDEVRADEAARPRHQQPHR